MKLLYTAAAARGESPLSGDNNIPNWSATSPCKTIVATSAPISSTGRGHTIDRGIWSDVEYRYDGVNALGGGSRADYK